MISIFNPAHLRMTIEALQLSSGSFAIRKRKRVRSLLIFKNVFDLSVEQTRDLEGQGQGGIVSASFNSVDCLPGDIEVIPEHGLGPASFRTQRPKAVLHQKTPSRFEMNVVARPWIVQKIGRSQNTGSLGASASLSSCPHPDAMIMMQAMPIKVPLI